MLPFHTTLTPKWSCWNRNYSNNIVRTLTQYRISNILVEFLFFILFAFSQPTQCPRKRAHAHSVACMRIHSPIPLRLLESSHVFVSSSTNGFIASFPYAKAPSSLIFAFHRFICQLLLLLLYVLSHTPFSLHNSLRLHPFRHSQIPI